ncbi:MAG: mandelate racemase/muconate lactonizing enzyme family protein [Halobacteriaceae archaeon]
MSKDDPEYVIPEGGGVPWRDLRRQHRHRPSDRDLSITAVETAALQGNFTWGLVKVETDAGIDGFGETFIGEEALDIAERLESLLVGETPLDTRRLLAHLDQERPNAGSMGQAAFAAIEIALLDIKGKFLDVPVYELLGGAFREEVPIYCDAHAGASLGAAPGRDPQDVYTPASYAEAARAIVDEGFEALKFDLDVPSHEAVDTAARRLDNAAIEHKVSLIEAVREEIGNDVTLGVDLHWNFTAESAIRLGRKLEPFDLAWIEDPCPPERVSAHRRVARELTTPILTGENLTTAAEFADYLPDALDIAAPDINRAGGLMQLVRIADLCDLHGVPLAPHNISSPLGTVAGVHAAAAIPNMIAVEYHARDVPWWDDLVDRTGEDGPIIEDGSVQLPEGPGLGIELNEAVAREHLVEGETLF